MGRARIRRRGEQSDDAKDADEIVVLVDALDADVIHDRTPMHTRAGIGLGDHQGVRLLQESPGLGIDRDLAAALGEDFVAAPTQDAERCFRNCAEHVAAVAVDMFTHAQEHEVVLRQPFQELDGIGDLLFLQRRRIGFELGHDLAHALENRAPVRHRQADVRERGFERSDHGVSTQRVVDAVDVHMDEAFARARPIGAQADDIARTISVKRKNRMSDEVDLEPLRGQFAHDGVDKKRHIVVDDLEDGGEPARGPRRRARRQDPDFGHARFAFLQKSPGPSRELREFTRLAANEILGRDAREQLDSKILRNVACDPRQNRAGLVDQPLSGALFFRPGKALAHGIHLRPKPGSQSVLMFLLSLIDPRCGSEETTAS
jgi:hypothetical protein